MSNAEKVRSLNDSFRQSLVGGRVMMTRGIVGRPDSNDILQTVQRFDAFTNDNDPYGEHDFGAFVHHGQQIFWKIDAYDADLQMGSPDPSDPNVTVRVLTIMLAEEY